MTRYVLDSYAVLAATQREPAGGRVLQLINDSAHQHWMSVINVGEVYYRTVRERGTYDAVRAMIWMKSFSIQFVGVSLETAEDAAQIKAKYAISYADCFAAALSHRMQAKIVTGDPEFQKLEDAGLVEIEWLQAKPRRSTR